MMTRYDKASAAIGAVEECLVGHCAQCDSSLRYSPSDYFCSDACQHDWHRERTTDPGAVLGTAGPDSLVCDEWIGVPRRVNAEATTQGAPRRTRRRAVSIIPSDPLILDQFGRVASVDSTMFEEALRETRRRLRFHPTQREGH